MNVKPRLDESHDATTRRCQIIGFVDTEDQLGAVSQALKGAVFIDTQLFTLRGEEGIGTLKQMQQAFNFGDGEDEFIAFALRELRNGHFAIGVGVDDRDGGVRVAELAEPLGAHSFSYFGTWENERLTR